MEISRHTSFIHRAMLASMVVVQSQNQALPWNSSPKKCMKCIVLSSIAMNVHSFKKKIAAHCSHSYAKEPETYERQCQLNLWSQENIMAANLT